MYWTKKLEGFKFLELADNVSFCSVSNTYHSPNTVYTSAHTHTYLVSDRISVNACGMNG